MYGEHTTTIAHISSVSISLVALQTGKCTINCDSIGRCLFARVCECVCVCECLLIADNFAIWPRARQLVIHAQLLFSIRRFLYAIKCTVHSTPSNGLCYQNMPVHIMNISVINKFGSIKTVTFLSFHQCSNIALGRIESSFFLHFFFWTQCVIWHVYCVLVVPES